MTNKTRNNSYKIIEESVNTGNSVLYSFCKKYKLDDSIDTLASKIWIIGRSYAASPERRSYGDDYCVKNKERKLNLNTGSNGTDSFFWELAKNIINDEDYDGLKKEIQKLYSESYKYDLGETDKKLLIRTIKIIFLFNDILRRAIIECDKKELERFEELNNIDRNKRKIKNFISFSSKFIHFHVPKCVFIIDKYSSVHATRRKTRSTKSIYVFCDNDGNCLLELEPDSVIITNINDLETEQQKDYCSHAERCYSIMCELHKKYNVDITPRMVDNFLLQVNTKT